MRILAIHADYIEIEPKKKAINDAEDLGYIEKKKYEEVLVVFTAVEKEDEDAEAAASWLVQECLNISQQVKTKEIVLYPLVHLTSKPSSPKLAKSVIQRAEQYLKEKDYSAHHSPFGWYKGYTLKCKGHPLAELSREAHASSVSSKTKQPGDVSESLMKENELKTSLHILDLDGNLHAIDSFNFRGFENLEKFATYETRKVRTYDEEPAHIRIMKEQGLIDYEPGSDSGNFRILPKGRLMKKILDRMVTDWCIDSGAIEVETPIMYDYEHPSLKKYLNRFPARQYVVLSENKNLFLRFAGCFGSFLLLHDATIPYKSLPLKIFELARYAFRREQSGELAGLKRLRAFTMPDMHTLVADMDQAKKEFEAQYEMGLEWNRLLGLDTEVGFRVQEDFFNQNRDWYLNMVKKAGKPILVELFKERYAYFITKFEFNFVDGMNKASALTTVQIDIENADTYDINFVDSSGNKKRPLILHASVSGSTERVLYALLEKEAMRMKKGKKAMFPVWLSPVQLRIIPVSAKQRNYSLEVLERLGKRKIRVDCDDRDEKLGKKIRNAGMEWIPYVAVIGDQEIETGKITLTSRITGEKLELSEDEIAAIIEKENQGKPFEKLSLDKCLSKRPLLR